MLILENRMPGNDNILGGKVLYFASKLSKKILYFLQI